MPALKEIASSEWTDYAFKLRPTNEETKALVIRITKVKTADESQPCGPLHPDQVDDGFIQPPYSYEGAKIPTRDLYTSLKLNNPCSRYVTRLFFAPAVLQSERNARLRCAPIHAACITYSSHQARFCPHKRVMPQREFFTPACM